MKGSSRLAVAIRFSAVIAVAVMSAMIIIFIRAAKTADTNPHLSKTACHECHLRDPSRLQKDEASTKLFVSDIETICLRCHSEISLSMTHPTAVRPTIPIPPDMFLDWKGEITCTTCHYMHQDETSPYGGRMFLRRNSRGRDFCFECHKKEFLNQRSLGHALASGKAHRTRFTPFEGSQETIDESSFVCMTCHDGSVSGDAGTTTLNMGIWRHESYSGRNSHPVGVDYNRAWSRKKREYTPMAMLPDTIVLPNGKVECVSCHNLYSDNEHLLSINNYGSRLCLTCHIK